MALTDQEIQRLHDKLSEWKTLQKGTRRKIEPKDKISYEIIHTKNEITEAIAVAPVYGGKADYSQIAIVVAGTQSVTGNG